MIDRLLSSSMNLTVLALIASTGGGALLLGYWGLLEMLNAHPVRGGFAFAAAVVLAVASLKLARYKNDLVDR